jgi:hypothetical protein
MKKPVNAEKWGRATAEKRYAAGGRTVRERTVGPDTLEGGGSGRGGGGSDGRGPGSPKGEIVYNKPQGMQGLPGPPSFQRPNSNKSLPATERMIDSDKRNWVNTANVRDYRGNERPFGYQDQTPGARLRKSLKEGKNNDQKNTPVTDYSEPSPKKSGGRIKGKK